MTLRTTSMGGTTAPECTDDYDGECRGPVEYRMPLSGSMVAHPRCEHHWELRLQREEELQDRYPEQQPRDFDPGFAGERWDDDY